MSQQFLPNINGINPENWKINKIVGAILDRPAQQHSQSGQSQLNLGRIGL